MTFRLFITADWNLWQCYYPFGCFYNGAPWSADNRPGSRFPEQPDILATHFMLYTRGHSEKPHELFIDNFDSIRKSSLKNTNNLYFIIHGSLDNGNQSWILVSLQQKLYFTKLKI